MLRKRMCVLMVAVLLITTLSPMLVSADVGDTVWQEGEPNDLPEIANLIYGDETYVGTVNGDDLDLFVFTLPYTATVSMICTSGSATIAMGIFDNNMDVVCAYTSDYDEGLYHNFIYHILPAGVYYIALMNTDASAISEYLLYLRYTSDSSTPTTPTTSATQPTTPTTKPTYTPSIHKHSFVSTAVAPTCMSYGYTLHSCSTCDYSYKDNYGDKKGAHVFTDGGDVCHVCGVARADAPIVIAYNYSMVALQNVAGYEYSMNGVSFQKSPLFTNLSPSTAYYFCQRVAAKDGLPAGEISPAVKVITDPQPTTPNTTTTKTRTTVTTTATADSITTTTTTATTTTTTTATANTPDIVRLTHDKTGVQLRATSDVLDGGCELFVYTPSQSENEIRLHIIVTKDGVGVQPNGNVFVYMPIPDGMSGERFEVTLTKADGSTTIIDSTCQSGQLFFNIDAFGVLTISAAHDGTGDIDGNGMLSIMDAVQLYYHVNGKITLSDTENADITRDGKINIADAVALYYHVNGKIDTL